MREYSEDRAERKADRRAMRRRRRCRPLVRALGLVVERGPLSEMCPSTGTNSLPRLGFDPGF